MYIVNTSPLLMITRITGDTSNTKSWREKNTYHDKSTSDSVNWRTELELLWDDKYGTWRKENRKTYLNRGKTLNEYDNFTANMLQLAEKTR